jgi:hypothetical protein
MPRLSKTTEYAIKYLYDQNKSVSDIATELKVSLAQVESVIAKAGKTKKTSKAKKDHTKDLMIRQTSAKKNNTVSIMTESAAQLSDEFIKNMDAHKQRTQSYIFRPRD